jgi:hypothetical protein
MMPALTRSIVVVSATLGPMNRQALPCPARPRSNQEYRNRQPAPTENPSATPFGPKRPSVAIALERLNGRN